MTLPSSTHPDLFLGTLNWLNFWTLATKLPQQSGSKLSQFSKRILSLQALTTEFHLTKINKAISKLSQGYPPFNATLHIFPPDTATVAWCTAIGEEHRCAWWAILVMWSIDQFGEFESRPRFSETIVQSVIVSTLPAFWVRNKHLTASSPQANCLVRQSDPIL